MNYPFTIFAAIAALNLTCCKSEPAGKKQAGAMPEVVPELQENQLDGIPSALLSYATNSKVNWQPWSPQILEHAKKSKRMIFALLVSSRYSECYETLNAIDESPDLVNRINRNFVPVLADIDLNRETSLIGYKLSTESRAPISFPFLVLLSPEGSPVSWHPIPYSSHNDKQAFFDNTLEVVGRLWDESMEYVTRDSAEKAEFRSQSLEGVDLQVEELEERQRIYETSIKRIVSFYDEDISTFAGSGGLLPLGILDSLSMARRDPTLPDDLRDEIGRILEGFCPTILNSAMFDLLDGGVFPARRGSSWNLTLGNRDCATQARAIRILARMHELDAYPGTLEAAIDAAGFAENQFQTPDGLFSLNSMPAESAEQKWLWSMDQVSSALSEDELVVWTAYSSLSDIGNLATEADPNRTYFRKNSLAPMKSPQQVAELTGFDLGKVQSLIESGKKKLIKAREDRIPSTAPDPRPSALASFRMASAYAALFAATSDQAWLEKSVKLGKSSRAHFLANRFLNETPNAPEEGASDGRAFTYAIAVQSGLDLGAVTLEDDWYSWAQDLTTLLSEHFVNDKVRLLEVRKVSTVVSLDFEDRLMIYDDSTAGLVRLNLKRLDSLGFQTPPALKPWLNSLPPVDRIPIVFTDSLLAMSQEWNHTTLNVGAEASQELTEDVCSLPLQLYVRRRSAGAEITATLPNGSKTAITVPDQLENLQHQEQP